MYFKENFKSTLMKKKFINADPHESNWYIFSREMPRKYCYTSFQQWADYYNFSMPTVNLELVFLSNFWNENFWPIVPVQNIFNCFFIWKKKKIILYCWLMSKMYKWRGDVLSLLSATGWKTKYAHKDTGSKRNLHTCSLLRSHKWRAKEV